MTAVLVHVNTAPARAETRRLQRLPREKDKVKLDRVLHSGFVGSQAIVHVETGSLKSSGREKSDRTRRRWTGEISYGGPSAGPNNPVDYAIYEKARGDSHDFMANTHLLHEMYVKQIKEILAR